MTETSANWGNASKLIDDIVGTGRLGHAYLLLGASGSGKLDAAWALAEAAVCRQGRCGVCDDCSLALRKQHPDIHYCKPQSAQGYLVDQVRQIIDDLQLAPIRAPRKAYILDGAHRMTAASANALLKSLEEPPGDTVFILVATTRDAVLPTIASRCQAIQFPALPPEQALAALETATGADRAACRRALACCADAARAAGFVSSETRQAARQTALSGLSRVRSADALDLVLIAGAIADSAKESLADLEERQAAELQELADVLTGPAQKELEERQKRELAAESRACVLECLDAQRSLLRDALSLACGEQGRTPDNDDFGAQAATLANAWGADGLPRAIAAVGRARTLIERNVTPRLALEAMLFELKEMPTCRP